MRKLLCLLFGHKPKEEKLIYKSNHSELKTFKAKCKHCECNLFGKEDRGEFSGTLIKTFIKIS